MPDTVSLPARSQILVFVWTYIHCVDRDIRNTVLFESVPAAQPDQHDWEFYVDTDFNLQAMQSSRTSVDHRSAFSPH